MRRKPADRRTRVTSLGLEIAGAVAVVYAIATWSVPLAIALAGLLVIVAAQFLEKLL